MVGSVNHLTFAVSDLDRSFRFYSEVLGFKPVVRWSRGAYLTAGDSWIAIEASLDEPLRDRHYTHYAFSVRQAEFSATVARLREWGVEEWKANESEGDSFYLLDPDGHQLELHAGDLTSRLRSMKADPWDTFEFF